MDAGARRRIRELGWSLLLALLISGPGAATAARAQTVWTGPPVVFTKANFADPTHPANQDAIVPGIVAITRASNRGLFNIAVEEFYVAGSPVDTEWAWTLNNPALSNADIRAANHAALHFDDWVTAHGSQPLDTVGIPGVLHIISQDVYIDVTFTAWTAGAAGGGFSYRRSTPPPAVPADSALTRAACVIALLACAALRYRVR